MTHYAPQDYFCNNENDALSLSTERPIDNCTIYNNIYDEGTRTQNQNQNVAFAHNEYQWTSNDERSNNESLSHEYANEYYDNVKDNMQHLGQEQMETGDYWDENRPVIPTAYEEESGYGRRGYASPKLLPVLPRSNIGEDTDEQGTYSRRGRGLRFDANADGVKSRMLPQTVPHTNVYANSFIGHAGGAPSTCGDDRMSTTPLRVLPQLRPRSALNQQFIELDANAYSISRPHSGGNLGNNFAMLDTVSPSEMDTTAGNGIYDVFGQVSRPYTSMLPLNYSDYSSDYGYNADNLSTYSDTPPTSIAQHKQQQRKLSLMMAMTTASVIASGETRVSVQNSKKQSQFTTSPPEAYTNALYDFSGNAIARASAMWPESEFCSSGTATTTQTAAPATISAAAPSATTSRKLPKRLPTPQYKSTIHSLSTSDEISGFPLQQPQSPKLAQTEKTVRTKQLPKLPLAQQKNPSNLVPDSSVMGITADVSTFNSALPSALESASEPTHAYRSSSEVDTSRIVTLVTATTTTSQSLVSDGDAYYPEHFSLDPFHSTINTSSYLNKNAPVSNPVTCSTTWFTSSVLSDSHSSSAPVVQANEPDKKKFLTDIDSSLHILQAVQISKSSPTTTSVPASPSPSTTTMANITEPEACAIDISEYLKPYTLDEFSFPSDIQNNFIISNTTTQARPSYARIPSPDPLPLSVTSLDSDMAYCVTTWTTSSVNIGSSVSYGGLAGAADSRQTATEITPSKTTATVATTFSASSSSYLLRRPSECELRKTFIEEAIFASSPATTSFSPEVIETSTSWSYSTGVFTTTALAPPLTTTVVASADLNTVMSDSHPVSHETPLASPTLTYVNYMKKFDLPELPPILKICTLDSPAMDNTDTALDNVDKIDNAKLMEDNLTTSTGTIPVSFCLGEPVVYSTDSSAIATSATVTATYETVSTWPMTEAQSVVPSDNRNFADAGGELSTTCSMAESLSTAKAFDDHFYDSFNVDLTVLTESIKQVDLDSLNRPSEVSTVNEQETITQFGETTSMNETNDCQQDEGKAISFGEVDKLLNSGQGGYYKPPERQPSLQSQPSSVKASLSPLTPQKAKTVASAATSVLGGLSKGIKGGLGLESVFSGTSTTEVSQQQGNSAAKKGFGFGLASKFVPSVGGLLNSTSKQASETTTIPEIGLTNEQIDVNAASITPTSISPIIYNSTDISNAITSDSVPSKKYYLDGEMELEYRDSYDDIQFVDDMISVEDSRTGVLSFHDEYSGYCGSAYSYEDPYKRVENEMTMDMNASNAIVTGAQYLSLSSTPKVDAASLQRSLESETSESQQQYPVEVPMSSSKSVAAITSTSTATSGMLGSILGKAAAAVQSATQVVNQGASSVATAVTQKATSSCDQKVIIQSHTQMKTTGLDAVINNEYNIPITNEESVSSQYSNSGDDYGNRNVHTFTNNDNTYYSNGNQSHSEVESVEAGHSMPPLAGSGVKQLPTVPPAGSTGKKLPTINGKSGLLIKQMPTEIFDDESDIDIELDALIDHDRNYGIDGEQDDYYLDDQQTTPSNRPNGYYEHVGSGYDYREDYFNEEDEYKYLEQQRQQQQQTHSKAIQQQQQHKMLLTHNQSSLDYIDEGQDDDFTYDNYQSEEDSGNYLDESSSGSVGIVDGRKTQKQAYLPKETLRVAADTSLISGNKSADTSLQLTSTHQQIKKQDSIIIEESEARMIDPCDNRGLGGSLPAQQSHDLSPREEEANDQLSDLADLTRVKSQKKRVLVRGETEEVVSGHMQILRKTEITARQRWHWAYNKIIMQLNVSTKFYTHICIFQYSRTFSLD